MPEAYQTILAHITDIVGNISQTKGLARPVVRQSTRLLGGDLPLDSMDLATVVLELETRTGYDPFKEGFINFRTVDELARLYVQ
jgi:acyl carrier protein